MQRFFGGRKTRVESFLLSGLWGEAPWSVRTGSLTLHRALFGLVACVGALFFARSDDIQVKVFQLVLIKRGR